MPDTKAKEKTDTIPSTIRIYDIGNHIYTIRDKQVMLDYDLAALYGYEVRALNQQVKRNSHRFPDDFMFQLTKDEVEIVKSQIVTSPNSNFYSGQEGGRRKPPYAFTEQGIYMMATVLKGDVAEQQSIFIMRAFREMRRFITNNALLFEKVSHIELKQLEYPKLTVKKTQVFHDRFIILDGKTAYHIGASIKDAGKKCFGISRLEDARIVSDLLNRLKTV